MAKLTLDTVTGGYDLSVINNNFDKIETAMENTLSRDGTAPNTLEDDLDVNGNRLYNVASLSVGSLSVGGQTIVPGDVNVTGIEERDNYAAIRAYTGTEVTFYVKGHTLPLDGGAGVFRYDASDTTSADNGGTILVDAVGRRWKREFSGAVKVLWFGAKGDGITDDTAAIQAAINFADGTEVFASAGIYKISSTVTSYNISGQISKGVRIRGEGPNKTVFKNTVVTGPCFDFDHRIGSTTYGNQVFSKGSYLKDLCITGSTDGIPTPLPSAQKTRTGNIGVKIKGLWSFVCSNVTISDHTSYGLWVDVDMAFNPDISSSVRINISGCWIAWNDIGIYAPAVQAMPSCSIQNTAIDFNDKVGVLHCSNYVNITEGSLSFNGFYTYSGDHSPNANYGGLVITNEASGLASGCRLRGVELDANMPQQIFVMASSGFVVEGCKVGIRIKDTETQKTAFVFGADSPAGVFKCINPTAQGCAFTINSGNYAGITLKVFKFKAGCSQGKVGKNTYFNSGTGLTEGANWIYIDEDVKTGNDAVGQRSLDWEFQNGYIFRNAYNVRYINGFIETIADDSVLTFKSPMDYGILMVHGGSSFTYGIIGFRAATGTVFAMATLSTGVNILTNTVLTGTTGTDGRLTISASNGTIYVENRLGSATAVTLRVITDLQYGLK